MEQNPNLKSKASIGIIPIILIIILVIIIGTIGYGLILYSTKKKEILENWPDYRCKPYILPIAGMINSNVSTTENYSHCLSSQNTSLFKTLLGPIYAIIDLITGILDKLIKSNQDIRRFIWRLRKNMRDMANNAFLKLRNTYIRLFYFFNRVKRLFLKLFFMFRNLFNVIKYIFYTFGSLWNGIPFVLIRFLLCFDEKTKIKMNNNEYKMIKDIQVNDILFNNNKVISKLLIETNNTQMYKFHGNIISENQVVLYNNSWIKIKDINDQYNIPIFNYNKPFIYCLTTEQGTIVLENNVLTRDYWEVETKNELMNVYVKKLGLKDKINCDIRRLGGFYWKTEVKLEYGDYMRIGDIRPGMVLFGGNRVIKIVRVNKNIGEIYEKEGYNGEKIIGTENLIINEKGKWMFLKDVEEVKKVSLNNSTHDFCQLVCENNIIETKVGLFRDYNIVCEEDELEIQNKIIENLNKKIELF
jgi:hypothetical protein